MKSFSKVFYFPLLILLLLISNVYSAATFTSGSTATQLASQIEGNGITISNPVITHGNGTQVGIYSNGIAGAGLEIDEGIILTGSTVAESFTTNSSWHTSLTPSGQYNDVDLLAIDSRAHYNPVIFEFDVTLDDNTRLLLIDYQFASDEYNEYVGSVFNDTFGFFISGGDLPANTVYNIARVVDNQTFVTINNINNYDPVTVNNVNNGTLGIYDDGTPEDLTNSAFFIDNDKQDGTAPIKVEYDGLTHTLHATLDNLTAGQTYHFKMALADTGDSQWDTGVFVNKISGLREPSICYDYAYKQNGLFLTEGYDATKGPFISGSVVANDSTLPLEVAMYFQNTKDSEIIASNISLDILDINTSQATYKPGSVFVTETNSLTKIAVADIDLNVSNSYIKEIPVTSFDAFEYFYTYFSLDPLVDTLSLPIVARITYDLTIPLSANDNLTITRSSLIDTDVPICGGGVTAFEPVYGAFNIIENGLYTDATNYLYNINTQVTNRDANLSIVAIDMNTTANPDLHTLKDITTIVGVDMLDLKSFHYTGASCSESGNSITERAWVVLNNTSKVPLRTNNVNFYQTARENVALRVSYNVDDNGSLITLEPVIQGIETRWNILNFPDTVKLGQCIAPVTDTVAQRCSNAGTSFNDAMTKSQLDSCMNCVYGINTKLVCARDNFAIRPEAFLLNLKDQNQTTFSNEQNITTVTGNLPGGFSRLKLAAGYNYILEANATNHLNDTSSVGYNFHINDITGTSAKYVWSPRVGLDETKCNETNDSKLATVKFINGAAKLNTWKNQVGDYLVHLLDTAWTSIDSVQQSHHSSAHFLAGSDCVLNSSIVATTAQNDNLNGCDISSVHTNSENSLKYADLNITFYPYKFDVTQKITMGRDNKDFNATNKSANFVYMSDITDLNVPSDVNISVQLQSNITALSHGNVRLTNYVSKCYAQPLNIEIKKSPTFNKTLDYRFVFYDVNNTENNVTGIIGNAIVNGNANLDKNITFTTTPTTVTATNGFFLKDDNGTLYSYTAINFDRNQSLVANPEDINYTDINVTDPNNEFYADLENNTTAEGYQSIGEQVTHYFGRTAAKKTKIICAAGDTNCRSGINGEPDVLIYYEVYCYTDANSTLTGSTCKKTLLPLDSVTNNPVQKVDSRWYVNMYHKEANDGNLTVTVEENGINRVTVPTDSNSNDYTKDPIHHYNTINGLPYYGYMEDTVPAWLLYDENNATAVKNKHLVIYKLETQWSGEHENNTTTTTDKVRRVNRRTMW